MTFSNDPLFHFHAARELHIEIEACANAFESSSFADGEVGARVFAERVKFAQNAEIAASVEADFHRAVVGFGGFFHFAGDGDGFVQILGIGCRFVGVEFAEQRRCINSHIGLRGLHVRVGLVPKVVANRAAEAGEGNQEIEDAFHFEKVVGCRFLVVGSCHFGKICQLYGPRTNN